MRALCPTCEFILERCLCSTMRPVHNSTELIILQHPSEMKHALGTVKIMKKTFQNIHVFVGEHFSKNEQLQRLLSANNTALVFPGTGAISLEPTHARSISKLILIDGTWKKAKKIYYLNPFLQSLPVFRLQTDLPSQYKIRQSAFQHSFATLEAAVAALAVLEPQTDCGGASEAFKAMIDFQIEKMGLDVFEKNYQKQKGR